MLETIKQTKDAQQPDSDEANFVCLFLIYLFVYLGFSVTCIHNLLCSVLELFTNVLPVFVIDC